MAAGLSAALRALMSISRVIADCIATQRAITSAGASFPRSIAILLSITHRGGGRELSRAAFWSRLHQKVFEFEQFTQVVNCLISILLVADSLKPMMDLAPGRGRPTFIASSTKARASASEARRRGFGWSLTRSGGSIRKSSMKTFIGLWRPAHLIKLRAL